jgi:hypothetical protein
MADMGLRIWEELDYRIDFCRVIRMSVQFVSKLEDHAIIRGTASVGLVVRVPGYRSRGPGFDSQRYHIFWEVVGLERGPLSLVSTTEELLGRNISSSGSGLENREYGRGDPLRWPRDTYYPQKLALTLPTNGGRSVVTVRLLSKATVCCLFAFAIIRVVSRRLPTAAARGRSQVKSCEMSKKWYKADSLQVLVPEFPLPIFIPQTSPHSLIILSYSTVIYIYIYKLFRELHVCGISNCLLCFKFNCTYRVE